MPSNPNKDDWKARRAINKILSEAIKDKGEISFLFLIREVLLNFPVSETMVKNFVKTYYVETGEYTLNEDILRRAE